MSTAVVNRCDETYTTCGASLGSCSGVRRVWYRLDRLRVVAWPASGMCVSVRSRGRTLTENLKVAMACAQAKSLGVSSFLGLRHQAFRLLQCVLEQREYAVEAHVFVWIDRAGVVFDAREHEGGHADELSEPIGSQAHGIPAAYNLLPSLHNKQPALRPSHGC